MDSYDYENALDNILPRVVEAKKKKSDRNYMVLRPDSGDPKTVVLEALVAAEKNFGTDTNKKGFKVTKGVGVIQGDGVHLNSLADILDHVVKNGYSAQNVAFGMGGGLLQKVNRDTMSFATKLSFIEYPDGSKRDIMKFPKSDQGKISLPGVLKVVRDEQGHEYVYPKEEDDKDENNLLKVVYDCKPSSSWDDFETIRKRVADQWTKAPKVHDVISNQLKEKIKNWIETQKAWLDQVNKTADPEPEPEPVKEEKEEKKDEKKVSFGGEETKEEKKEEKDDPKKDEESSSSSSTVSSEDEKDKKAKKDEESSSSSSSEEEKK